MTATPNTVLATAGSVSIATSNLPGHIRIMLTGDYDTAAKAVEAATGERFTGRHLDDFEMSLEEAIEQVAEITGITVEKV